MALSNDELTNIAFRIADRFEKVNIFYLSKMAEQIKDIGKLDKDNMHRLEQMVKMGNNIEEINLYLSKQSGLALQDIYKLYDKSAGEIYKDVKGDFVVMATIDDMEGLAARSVTGFNEGGILIRDGETFYQLGAFPLYNCGNMLTSLSKRGRPQFPNYKGYDFDPIIQFERKGDKLFARTSKDGKVWANMPGSPLQLHSESIGIGAYQTTYTEKSSWVKLKEYRIYEKRTEPAPTSKTKKSKAGKGSR